MSEELVGGQKKLDANKNKRLDSHDFKILRAKKTTTAVKEGTGYSDEEVKSGKQRSGRPYPEAKFPGWKVGKNMQTQKVKNGKKIGAARTIAAVDSVEEETTPKRGATSKQLDAEKIMDYQAAQKFYEKDMPNQIMRARLEDRKRTAAKNSVKEDVEQVDELSKGLLKRYKAAATVNADNLEKEGDRHSRNVQHGNLTSKEKKLSMKIRSRMYGKSDERRFKIAQAERKLGEETEQIDELSKKTKDAYIAKRGSQLSSMMYGSGKNYNSLTGKKQANAVKGIKKAMGMKEEPEQREDGIDLTAFMEKANSAIKEAVGDASSPEAFVRKFNKMTDVNDHTGAAILLATFLKDTKAMKCLKLVKQIHELESSMPEGIFKYRTAWTTYLWKGFSMKYPQVNRNIINNESR